jgi:hypothetical protein
MYYRAKKLAKKQRAEHGKKDKKTQSPVLQN